MRNSTFLKNKNKAQFEQLGGDPLPPSEDDKWEEQKWNKKFKKLARFKLARIGSNQSLRNVFFQN